MPERSDMLREAARRGVLPPEQQRLYDEAARRGLVRSGDDPLELSPQMTRTGALARGAAAGAVDLARGAAHTVVPQLGVLDIPRGEEVVPGFEEAQEQHPTATTAGGIVADVAALLGVRTPVSRAFSRPSPMRLSRRDVRGPVDPRAVEIARASMPREPGLRKMVDDVMSRPAMQRLGRGFGRAIETGAEGAALAILHDEDPVMPAAYAAGVQAGGSMAMQGVSSLLSGGALRAGGKVAITMGSMAALYQVGKEMVPGGRDRILESIETAAAKVGYTLIAGAVAGAAGAGRVRSENLPVLADALQTLPRGIMHSLMRDFAAEEDAGETLMARTAERLTEAPERFTDRQRERLDQALERGDLRAVVARMAAEDESFRDALFAPSAADMEALSEAVRRSQGE